MRTRAEDFAATTPLDVLRSLPFPTAADCPERTRLARARDGVPVAGAIAGDLTWEQYCRRFLTPHPDFRCVGCGLTLLSSFWNAGTLVDGVAQGEAYCSVCLYPARLWHDVLIPGEGAHRIRTVMQYHPEAIR